MAENNMALNAKLGWRVMNKNSTPWIEALKAKYKVGKIPNKWKAKRCISHICKGIFKCKGILGKATRWTVGNERLISFWNDWWCGSGALQDLIPQADTTPTSVATIISDSGGWNLSNISPPISTDIHRFILSTPLPLLGTREDSMTWAHTGSGKFTVNSCYHYILKDRGLIHDNDTNWE